MQQYLVTLSYNGRQYSGWQRQTKNPNTIQEIFEEVLKRVLADENLYIVGASRTDTGVSALDQKLTFKIDEELETSEFMTLLNLNFPKQIRALEIKSVSPKYNLQADVLKKTYTYKFGFSSDEYQNHYYPGKKFSFDLKLAQSAVKLLIGTHEFKYFSSSGNRTPKTQRNIEEACLKLIHVEKELYEFEITADGFLKYMVRYLAGAIYLVGTNQLAINDYSLALAGEASLKIKKKLPGHGLTLKKIYLRSEIN